jgi:hypothetical protein
MAEEPREPHEPHESQRPEKPKLRQGPKWPDFPPRPELLLAIIRTLIRERRYAFMNHAQDRFLERGFDIFDFYYVLEHGHIDGKIEAGKRDGEWKVKVVDVPKGTSRKMGVVTIVVKEIRLLIKTVEWEDR